MPPVIVAGAVKVLDLIGSTRERRDKLEEKCAVLEAGLLERSFDLFDLKEGESPTVPVMPYNAKLAQDVAPDLFAEGIYVVAFLFPVLAKGQVRMEVEARLRRHWKYPLTSMIRCTVVPEAWPTKPAISPSAFNAATPLFARVCPAA